MIDFGFDKIALIGAVALIVIGPEKLPRVARTVGTFMGKARRYVAEVKAEVNRTIELEELQKVKSQFETAARDVQDSVRREVQGAETEFNQAFSGLNPGAALAGGGAAALGAAGVGQDPSGVDGWSHETWQPTLSYRRPDKHWRLKKTAVPRWYKQRAGVRSHLQSGAARVARFRPKGL